MSDYARSEQELADAWTGVSAREPQPEPHDAVPVYEESYEEDWQDDGDYYGDDEEMVLWEAQQAQQLAAENVEDAAAIEYGYDLIADRLQAAGVADEFSVDDIHDLADQALQDARTTLLAAGWTPEQVAAETMTEQAALTCIDWVVEQARQRSLTEFALRRV